MRLWQFFRPGKNIPSADSILTRWRLKILSSSGPKRNRAKTILYRHGDLFVTEWVLYHVGEVYLRELISFGSFKNNPAVKRHCRSEYSAAVVNQPRSNSRSQTTATASGG
jgi:hypothetical protein